MKKFAIGLCGFALILFIQQSCTKIDTTTLGVDLIPTVDNVTTFDTTLDVITTNFFLDDSTRITSESSHALGALEDADFGKTRADVYFNVSPPVNGQNPFINKDSVQVIDSVVLTLSYQGLYGDSNSVQNIKVYEIAQSATNFTDSVFGMRISNPDFPVVSTPLGQKLVDFTTLNDSIRVGFKSGVDTPVVVNELHIRLDNSFGRRLADYDTTNAYKSDSIFHASYFKGFALKVDEASSPVKRALAYFNVSDEAKTKLRIYYRTPSKDTLVADFTFVGYANANLVKRNITGTPYANNIASGNNNKEKLYLQSSPGSLSIVTVPGLKNLYNRVINKAQLIVPILASTDNNVFDPPDYMFLDLIDSAKNRYKTIKNDFTLSNTGVGYNYTTFGGFVKNNQITFDLSRHVQQIVTDKIPVLSFRMYAPYTTYPLYAPPNTPASDTTLLFMTQPLLLNYPVGSGRVVVAGGSLVNQPSQRMRLRIIYTKI